jgi:microcompartment protein CcmL/EutN
VSTNGDALGLLEVVGFTAAIGAADAMSKAAQITVRPLQRIGDGLVTLVAEGDIASVREAVEAGAERAEQIGRVVARDVIGRPAPDLATTFRFDRAVLQEEGAIEGPS